MAKYLFASHNWGGFYALDIYNEEVRQYLKKVFDTVLNTWGYDMVKLDFLYACCIIPYNNKSRGEITTAPAYVGDTGLFECLWRVVNTPELTVDVVIGKPFTGEDRHSLCKKASAVMSAVIGVEDPLAEKSVVTDPVMTTAEAVHA